MDDQQSGGAEQGLISRALVGLTAAVCWRPWITLSVVGAVTLALAAVSITGLKFKTNRSDLIDPHAAYQQRWLRYTERFGDDSDVVVVVEGKNASQIIPVLSDLGRKLEAQPEFFDRVLYRDDTPALRSKGLQYLRPQDLESAEAMLRMYGPILAGHWDRAGVESYAQRLSDYIQLCSREKATADLAGGLAQAGRFIDSFSHFLQQPGDFRSPWPEVVKADAFSQQEKPQSHSLVIDSGRMGFVLLVIRDMSENFSGASPGLDRLRAIVQESQSRFPNVHIGLTGVPILEADEMKQSQDDMSISTIVAFVGVSLILLIGLRGFRHPALAVLVLIVGLVWSLGFTWFAVGHLNILSVSFAAILIGMGIDFALHYLVHYVERRREGAELKPVIMETAAVLGPGILMASATTAMAFFSATFTDFLGIVELGTIAGGGVIICALATLIVLPALISVADRKIDPKTLPAPFEGTWIRKLTSGAPRLVTFLSVIVVVAIAAQTISVRDGHVASRIKYDYNLLNLQGKGLESVELQDRISEATNGSLLYAVSMANSPEQTRLMKERFLALPTVSRVEELATALPTYPPEETNLLVRAIHAQLSLLSNPNLEPSPLNPAAVGQSLENLQQTLKSLSEPEAQRGAATLDALLDRFEQLPLEHQTQILTGYQQALQMSLQYQLSAVSAVSNPEPVGPKDFPTPVRSRFVSDHGDWLLRVYPTQEIWDEAPLREFVASLRTVDPEVTGTPVQNLEAATQIERSYRNAAVYSFAAILLVLLLNTMNIGVFLLGVASAAMAGGLSYWLVGDRLELIPVAGIVLVTLGAVALLFDRKGLSLAVLSLLPPLAGCAMMFGILAMFKIDLNPANLIVLPLILGLGVDNGIYVTQNYRYQPGRYEMSAATMNAVVLTTVTSLVGFGSMLLAAHRGLVSLGMVLVVGLTCELFIAMILLPAILSWITRNRPANNISDEDDEEEAHVVPMSLSSVKSSA